MSTTIFTARAVITMDPSRPQVEAVAVREGRILALGSKADLCALPDAKVDDRFGDAFLMPGLIEGHSHAFEGAVWRSTYIGYHDRTDEHGHVWKGIKTIDEAVSRLKQAAEANPDPAKPVLGWGFDPIYFKGRRMNRHDLDRVATNRPVAVMHASFHIVNVNTEVLTRSNITAASNAQGIVREEDGTPNGELQGPTLRFAVAKSIGNDFLMADRDALMRFGRIAARAGVTTATDLHAELPPAAISTYSSVTEHPDYPIRLVPALSAMMNSKEKVAALLPDLKARNSDRLHFGLVKLVLDGSIQGFTARLKWPGYHNGAPNGLWYVSPPDLPETVLTFHRAGAILHMHTNGDEATDLALDAIDYAQTHHYRASHRTTIQHCQMASPAQFARMKALGAGVNLFTNHIYYWGDEHRRITMGPDRAERLDACGAALRAGLPLAIHSDAPITPIAPLFSAWCAVNRITSSGRLLGPYERIGVADALHAITLGAAWTLGLDHEIGSIEIGKRADFTALHENPLMVEPMRLRDIAIKGTVLGGRVTAV